jgi:preprotein translocase subunit SecA
MSFLNKFFGDPQDKYLKTLQPIVEKINGLELKFKDFSKEQLKSKTSEFRSRFQKGETLDALLPEAFALVRETSKRTLNQRHFDVQIIGGIVLHQGKITEMKTGEGKTLASTLPIYLNGLTGKGVHVVTVNDYLAKRDMVWMGQIYHGLELSVGCIVHNAAYIYDPEFQNEEKDKERDVKGGFKVVESYLRPCLRKEAYSADITYGTNNEFGFDYLRDNMAYDLKNQCQRGFNYAIVDEVDSILIDEARTPLIISAPDTQSSEMYKEFARIMPRLKNISDYTIDEKMKAVTLTEAGIEKVEKILGMKDIYQEKGIKYLHHLEQGLRAEVLFKRDRDYVVKNNEAIIVDEFTGRLMPGRRWSGGLHQAIEAKEGVRVQPESMTLASITFQNYFRLYKKLGGMTGTAATSAEEFYKVYGLEVIVIPTNKPMLRENLPDRVYKSEKGKFDAVVKEIKTANQKLQPVLVGTISIEKNEHLGKLLGREGIPHQILNAKHHEKEGEIIAQAGRLGQVTIATNMAGRGVDIILSGNPPDKDEAEKIKKLGGLYVIGTDRHEARRIDNQLRGRCGRQGDPGMSRFFVSLEDDVLRIFGGDRIKNLMEKFNLPEDQPIEANLVSGAIESAQTKIEGMNFDLRHHILEYDDVMNKQRETIYRKRREILEKARISNLKPQILEIMKKAGYSEEDYQKKEAEVGDENMRQVEKVVALRTLDMLWMEHLENMEYLRDSVRLRAYGQRDPLVEYKNEGHRMFQALLKTIDINIAQTLMRVSLKKQDSGPVFSQPSTTADENQQKKPGRNDPCPCGKKNPITGKPIKYKKCCGK